MGTSNQSQTVQVALNQNVLVGIRVKSKASVSSFKSYIFCKYRMHALTKFFIFFIWNANMLELGSIVVLGYVGGLGRS